MQRGQEGQYLDVHVCPTDFYEFLSVPRILACLYILASVSDPGTYYNIISTLLYDYYIIIISIFICYKWIVDIILLLKFW